MLYRKDAFEDEVNFADIFSVVVLDEVLARRVSVGGSVK